MTVNKELVIIGLKLRYNRMPTPLLRGTTKKQAEEIMCVHFMHKAAAVILCFCFFTVSCYTIITWSEVEAAGLWVVDWRYSLRTCHLDTRGCCFIPFGQDTSSRTGSAQDAALLHLHELSRQQTLNCRLN